MNPPFKSTAAFDASTYDYAALNPPALHQTWLFVEEALATLRVTDIFRMWDDSVLQIMAVSDQPSICD
jgi:hypothetical protein